MRRIGLAVLLAGVTVCGAGGGAYAMSACKMDAQQAFQDCKQSCRDDFTAAKLVCRNIDPVCGSACVDANRTCRQNVETILDTGQVPTNPPSTLTNCSGGTEACDAALQQARQACWAQFCAMGQTCTSCSDPNITDQNGCFECVDAAQLTAFTCRDTCRDSFRTNTTVQAMKSLCKTTLNSCIHACPTLGPAPTPTPTP